MSKIVNVTAAGIGYVLGARAGRERYEQITTQARKLWGDPRVQQAASAAAEKAPVVKDKITQAASSVGGRSTGDSGTV